MKPKLKLFVMMMLTIASSCKKDSPPSSQVVPVKLLSKVTQVQYGETSFTFYTYDDKHRLKTIKDPYGTLNYTYDGDFLSAIEPTLGSLGKIVMTYRDGKLSKAVRTFPDKIRTYGFIYSADQVSEVHANENGVVVNVDKHTYSNHNIIQTTSDYGQGLVTQQFIYGKGKNKFFNSAIPYINGVETMDRYSSNEVLESKISYANGSFLTIKNIYTYDSEGFPTTQISTYTTPSGASAGESRYSYEYEMSK